jgi:hypothetical protein
MTDGPPSPAATPEALAAILRRQGFEEAVAASVGQDEGVLQSNLYQQIRSPEIMALLGFPGAFVAWGQAIHNPGSSHPRKIDLLVGSTPIEVKAYGSFAKSGVRDGAARQVDAYRALLRRAGHDAQRAWATDGRTLVEVAEGGQILSDVPLDADAFAALLAHARGTRTLVYNGASLAALFAEGPDAPLRRIARLFFEILGEVDQGQDRPAWRRTVLLRKEWLAAFKVGHARDLLRLQGRRRAMAEALSNPATPVEIASEADEYRALFALYTAYALFVKVAAHQALRRVCPEIATYSSSGAGPDLLRHIESGRLFREIGLYNVLEGDAFSWYLDALADPTWGPRVRQAVEADLVAPLARIAPPSSMEIMADSDMFRKTYESLVPARVRHALGEFFTPLWLAEDTLDRTLALGQARRDWRGLDPTCGSGAFLCAMLRRKVAQGRTLPDILEEVAGIDINPLSALTARVNYVLHLLPLVADAARDGTLSRARPRIVPVFMGDACNLPVLRDGWLETTLQGNDGSLDIRFPAEGLENPGALFAAFARLEAAIDSRRPDEGALALAPLIADVAPDRRDDAKAAADALVRLLCSPDDPVPGIVWGRLVANRLALATLRRQDVLVGNPPWVKWSVLPDRYRADLSDKPFTTAIFSADKHLGGNNLNVCALVLFAAVHRFVGTDGAHVGMLMPNDLLFTASHRIWRRFNANGVALDLRQAIDWSRVRGVFDGVSQPFWAYLFEARRET